MAGVHWWARPARSWRRMMVVPLLLATACGSSSGGKEFDVAPGTTFDSVPADRVIVVTEARNQCESSDRGPCTTPPPGPCTLGKGNVRGLAVYRLGATGLLYSPDGNLPVAEQVIGTDDNPRRIAQNPNDPTIVYVATFRRIQVFKIGPNGTSRCIGETASEEDIDARLPELDPTDLEIDATIGNGILYVAGRGSDRIDAYVIADDGTISALPQSCIVGSGDSEYEAVTPATANFIIAGGRDRVEIYPRENGLFPTPTATPRPETTATPTPADTPTPTPVASPVCIGAVEVNRFISDLGVARVLDILFEPQPAAPIGQLLIAEEGSQRLFTFPIDSEGNFDTDDSSHSDRIGIYERVLRLDRNGLSTLYASCFDQGRVDVFALSDDLVPNKTFSRTRQGVNALPVAIKVDGPSSILYVTQAGFNRIDGYQLASDGSIANDPLTSTQRPLTADGREIDVFPDDLVFMPLP